MTSVATTKRRLQQKRKSAILWLSISHLASRILENAADSDSQCSIADAP